MSKQPIISVKNASVNYKRLTSNSISLKQFTVDKIRNKTKSKFVNALNDISFEIYPGEIVAIIGRNGSGKSTLLKVLARVIPPTSGRVIVRGHVEPMIELGVGFNPELSGEENIYLNAAIHGRNPKIVKERFNEIVNWSGLQDVINQPLRTYSSGMVARLGFAVATDINPDIVLIDEVLSVGDFEFMEKSKARMNQIMRKGATVILVSHDLEIIKNLATRVIWLENGKIKAEGKPAKIISQYISAK